MRRVGWSALSGAQSQWEVTMPEVDVEIDNEYFQCCQEIWLREFHKRAPESIWHYTDANGLNEILKSDRMRATNIKCLKDKTEFEYGKVLVKRVLAQKESESTDLKPLLYKVGQSIDLFRTQRDVYIVCFSTERDSSYLWPDYGAGGNGYSIAFISPRLNFVRHKNPNLRWCKVEYEETKQVSVLGAVVECWCSWVRRNVDLNRQLQSDVITKASEFLAYDLIRYLCRFKDETKYKKEAEWRLVYAADSQESSERHKFLDLSVEPLSHGAECGKLPIREVMHGPNLDPVMARESLESLLHRHKYLTVCASSSSVTLPILK